MRWIEPATDDDSHSALEKNGAERHRLPARSARRVRAGARSNLWDAENMLWAGADLKASEYSPTLRGLIFLRYANVRFAAREKNLKPQTGLRANIRSTDWKAPEFGAIRAVNVGSKFLSKFLDTLLAKLIVGELRIPNTKNSQP